MLEARLLNPGLACPYATQTARGQGRGLPALARAVPRSVSTGHPTEGSGGLAGMSTPDKGHG